MVDLAVLALRLDSMILKVFSKVNCSVNRQCDSMTLGHDFAIEGCLSAGRSNLKL